MLALGTGNAGVTGDTGGTRNTGCIGGTGALGDDHGPHHQWPGEIAQLQLDLRRRFRGIVREHQKHELYGIPAPAGDLAQGHVLGMGRG